MHGLKSSMTLGLPWMVDQQSSSAIDEDDGESHGDHDTTKDTMDNFLLRYHLLPPTSEDFSTTTWEDLVKDPMWQCQDHSHQQQKIAYRHEQIVKNQVQAQW